jgi:hypothetical protein
MATYPIFVAESMESTHDANLLRAGRYQVTGTDTVVSNGGLVMLDGFVTGQRDLYKCKVPTAITTTNLYIIDAPEVVYSEETTKGLDDFQVPAGQNARLRRPRVGDRFSLSANGITPITTEAAIAVGSFVIPTAGATEVVEVAAAGGTESFVAEIKDTFTIGYDIGGRAIVMFGCEVTKVL